MVRRGCTTQLKRFALERTRWLKQRRCCVCPASDGVYASRSCATLCLPSDHVPVRQWAGALDLLLVLKLMVCFGTGKMRSAAHSPW